MAAQTVEPCTLVPCMLEHQNFASTSKQKKRQRETWQCRPAGAGRQTCRRRGATACLGEKAHLCFCWGIAVHTVLRLSDRLASAAATAGRRRVQRVRHSFERKATFVETALRLCAQVFLVGDPNQLPATVISKEALEYGYDVSLFQRLQAAGHPVQVMTHATETTAADSARE